MDISGYLAVVFVGAATWLTVDASHVNRARGLTCPNARPDGSPMRLMRDRLAAVVGRRKAMDSKRTKVLQALTALSSELLAGQAAARAVVNASEDPQVWPHALAAARTHGDVAAGLSADSSNAPVLSHLAALWTLSSRSGIGLAESVSRLAASARRDEDVRVQLQAQLAGPRATARVLCFLPVIGLALGMLLGAQPLVWLLMTPLGWGCLALGILLTVTGLVWTQRIAHTVESQI